MKSAVPIAFRALAFCALAAVGGCGATAAASAAEPQAVLTGTVTYRERIALPPNARVEVRLEDVSQADAPADEIASQTIAANGKQVPIPFELPSLAERHRLESSLHRARIDHERGRRPDVHDGDAIPGAHRRRGGPEQRRDRRAARRRRHARRGSGASGGGADQGGAAASPPGGTWRLAAIQRARCDRAGGRRRPSLHGRVRRRKAVGPRALQPLHGRLRAAGARRARKSRRWPRR